ncbi:MAG: IS256 family transposase [Alphaproteobacteria bacterium]
MAKHRIIKDDRQAQQRGVVTVQLPLPVVGVYLDARSAFHELCIETGRQALHAMMEADRAALCGPKGKHNPDRQASRAGSAPSWVTLGGRQIDIRRLRVRSKQGEASLPSFAWAADRDPLDAHTLEAVAAGVSTRKYERTLAPVPVQVRGRSTKRSSVSRRFVALSTQQMHAFLSQPLEDLKLRVVMIDGKAFRDHCLLIALGIAADGEKHIVGLREGGTENSRVVRALLQDLVGRGLRTDRPLLFVIDGAKALRKAIRETFSEAGVVQRCQFHKRMNVLGHLPESLRPSVDRALRDAWEAKTAELAQRQLERLARSLEREHPGAAASIREGLEETLTLQSLGLSGALYRTLRTTNPIENLNGSVASYTRNVKRWRGGGMMLRWVSAALLEAKRGFRRVCGHRDLPQLIRALDAQHDEPHGDSMVA